MVFFHLLFCCASPLPSPHRDTFTVDLDLGSPCEAMSSFQMASMRMSGFMRLWFVDGGPSWTLGKAVMGQMGGGEGGGEGESELRGV